MTRRPRTVRLEWSPDVEQVPILNLSALELQRLSVVRGLGFSESELARIQSYYRQEGREPTDLELAGLAQSWSEHCSYKSSRPFLHAAFRHLRPTSRVLGTGDAGVMAFDDEYAYALRIESHNHPSAVEPYGGAATGIGGILRDVLAVGGLPIALADPLFFGPLDLPLEQLPPGVKSPRYLAEGVIAGIRDYGNRVGVPTVTGGVFFDPSYVVNPLVNVGCLGFLPRARLLPNRARRAGDALVLTGGFTGRDGIGGVAFASQELSERSEEESRGAVQLGNPILKEPLIRACVEAFDRKLVAGVKDLGGGGLATGSGELVHSAGLGSRINLDRVPLRETGLRPWEVWVSESQERMLLDVPPNHLEELLGIFQRFDVPATQVGTVTGSRFEEILWNERLAGRLEVDWRIEAPLAARSREPRTRETRPPPEPGEMIRPLFEELVLAPDSVSRESVIRVYEQEVGGRTVVKSLNGRVTSPSHGDAAVLRPLRSSTRGIAVTVAAQPALCREEPRAGAVAVVEEAARNLYAVGARPDSFTNCLNFGNPEDPTVLDDFAEVTAGLSEGARGLGFAVPSGNVSFYNGGLGHGIPPTPVLMATGLIDDVHRATTTDFKAAGDALYLLGENRPELGGSLYARRRGLTGIPIPPPNPAQTRSGGERLLAGNRKGIVRAAHDVSDGGLAVTLAEMSFGGGLGFSIDLGALPFDSVSRALAAEGGSRWVVEVRESDGSGFERLVDPSPAVRLGTVSTGEGRFAWKGTSLASVPIAALYDRWRSGLGIP